MEAAGAHFRLSIPHGGEGESTGGRLADAEERKRRRIELGLARPGEYLDDATDVDDVPEIPEAARYLMTWFMDLAYGRQNYGFGPCSLSATEILSWSQLSGNKLSHWEFRAVRMLDRVWLNVWAELNVKE